MAIRHPELTVRPLRAEEWETWHRNVEVAFGGDEEAPGARELWRRLIDAERTLVACADGRVVGGTTSFDFRLVAPRGPASCVRTDGAAELALDVRELGSVYLGGGSPAALAAAGLARELRPGALEPASAAFRSGLEPWRPHGI
ncbi:GNAT family N-acetyltransferase [Kitasatospora sp. NPDC001540]|uniref:GNAT family N-acetyltransferase n=1 Tax=Kitasatospora sp. NPDC001540 TaxID=3364014 RepID=UPI0036BA7B4A